MPATAVGKREGKIDEGVQQAPSREAIANQYPGDDHAEKGIHRRGDKGGEEAEAERARVRGPVTTSQKPAKPKLADLSTSAASGMRTIRLRYVK